MAKFIRLFCLTVILISEEALARGTAVAFPSEEFSDTVRLDDAVVSSLKIERNASEVPSDINVIGSLDLKKRSATTVADVLEREPGLNKGGDGIWSTSINVRGFSENRLVILVDRNRVETATDLTASLSMLNANDIERVEVIKGAQSSIYGSGAIGGIVNIVTKDGYFAETPYFKGNFTANYSSVNNGHGEYLSLYGGGSKWYVKINGAFARAGNTKTPSGIMPNSGYNSADVGAVAAFKPSEGRSLKLQFQRNSSWDVGIPGGASFTPVATASYKNIGRTLVSLNYDATALSQTMTHLNVKAFFQGINRDVEMLPNVPIPANGAVPTKVTPGASHNTFGASAEGSWQFGKWNTLTSGAEVWRRNISSKREKYISQFSDGILKAQIVRTEIPLPDASHTSGGIFAQDEMRLACDKLILSIGGRLDLNCVENKDGGTPPGNIITFAAGTRFNPSWSANAGLLFKAGAKTDLTLNFSRSYRSPAMEELFKFIDLSGNRVHYGNPDLKAEKGTGGDLGIRYHGEKLHLRFSVFAGRINDMIVERKVNVNAQSVNDTLMLDNASRALLYGFDGDVSYEFVKGLKVYACGGWTIGREIAGKNAWLPMIPPMKGRAGVCYDNTSVLGASLEMIAAGAREAGLIAEGERETHSWWRLDFAIHSRIFSFGRCNLQLFGGIENITDNAYTNFLATNRGNIISEPGRNIYFRLNFTF